MTETANYRVELITRLRHATDDLAWVLRGVNVSQIAYRPSPEEWSMHEHVAHLRDMEQEVYLPLLRWATVPDMLDPRDYSRRTWHEHRYRSDEPGAAILSDYQRIRDEEILIFRDMRDHTWTRWRNDTRWGPITCQWLAELMYRHILDHLQSMMALKQDIGLAALQPHLLTARLAGGAAS